MALSTRRPDDPKPQTEGTVTKFYSKELLEPSQRVTKVPPLEQPGPDSGYWDALSPDKTVGFKRFEPLKEESNA